MGKNTMRFVNFCLFLIFSVATVVSAAPLNGSNTYTGTQNTGVLGAKEKEQDAAASGTSSGSGTADSQDSDPLVAIISGVPRYYQERVSCEDLKPYRTSLESYGEICRHNKVFLTGCGPVAGATILGWYQRRGFKDLIDSEYIDDDGLPRGLILLLGDKAYMDRETNIYDKTDESWVTPGNLVAGLKKYFKKKGYRDVEIQPYTMLGDHYVKGDLSAANMLQNLMELFGPSPDILTSQLLSLIQDVGSMEIGTVDRLFEIVKAEILAGRPLVLLENAGGEGNSTDPHTMKMPNHYVTVVGYDNTNGDYRLIVQYNYGYGRGSALSPFDVEYKDDDDKTHKYITLKDHTTGFNSVILPYMIFTINPNASADYEGVCTGLTVRDAKFGTYQALDGKYDKCHLLDGYTNPVFRPDGTVNEYLGPTDQIRMQDGECFVAVWPDNSYVADTSMYDSDGDKYSDVCDYPELRAIIESVGYSETEDGNVEMDVSVIVGNVSDREDAREVETVVEISGTYADISHYLVDQTVELSGTGPLSSVMTVDLNSPVAVKTFDLAAGEKVLFSKTWELDGDALFGPLSSPLYRQACTALMVTVSVDQDDLVTEESELGCPGGCDGNVTVSNGGNSASIYMDLTPQNDCTSQALEVSEFDTFWRSVIEDSIMASKLKHMTTERNIVRLKDESSQNLQRLEDATYFIDVSILNIMN